jgi:hypothetical protein
MFALISPEKLELPAGSVVRIPASWQEYRNFGIEPDYCFYN